jgi:hypothetical protein
MCDLHDPMRFCIIIVSMLLVFDVDQAILMQYTMRSEFVQLLLKAENAPLCIERIEKEEMCLSSDTTSITMQCDVRLMASFRSNPVIPSR